MVGPIVVINPNSTRAVTQDIDRALEPLRLGGAPAIQCLTLADGPPAIESQADADAVIEPLCSTIRERRDHASAFVIACFSDPGIVAARAITRRPVFGIAESGILTALARGKRFGIVAILADSVSRHQRYIRSMRVEERFAGDLPIDMGVLDLRDEGRTFARMTEVGTRLRDEHGADVLILGCAGMARYRASLQEKLGVPVIDPTQSAVSMALGAVLTDQIVDPALRTGLRRRESTGGRPA